MEILRNLSNRELQAYAALCLHRFCGAKHIEHPYVDELLEHLLAMLITKKLGDWERKLAGLELSGAGDPIPTELETLISDYIRKDFHFLIECVVDVGVGDIYHKPSERPLNNLFRCLEVLDVNGVERPDVPEILKNKMRKEDAAPYTGETYSQEEYEQVKSLFH